jgi:hypothetical protein
VPAEVRPAATVEAVTGSATDIGRAIRWLLLLLTALGLTAMHTLGHAGAQMSGPATSAAVTLPAAGAPSFMMAADAQPFSAATGVQSFSAAADAQSFSAATGVQSFTAATDAQSFSAAADALSFTSADEQLPCAGDDCTHHHGMDGWGVCMAVLGGLVVIALLVFRPAARDAWLGIAASMIRWRGSRSPPLMSTGLLIASTAALRI